MPLTLFDTFSRAERIIQPSQGRVLRFYCCGPTVYGPAHIGNFRTFVIQDVFRRTVEAANFETLHVRNITNVDDKTIRQSSAEGRTLEEFTRYWYDQFHKDCEALNLLMPHVEPGAVEHIEHQIKLIDTLVKKGHAYAKNGSVYFKVDSFKNYGRLSHLESREITTHQEHLADADEYDRESAADFALWKARKPEDGDVFWPSPWGEGRPGWHIECSAMAMEYLGETMDLHSGGVDLCFPHHENEIAQSEAATGKTFAQHWFHITHLLVDGHKMSKSLGNLYTLNDVQKKGFTPMELRYVLLSGHYRQPLNFTWDSLTAARSALEKMTKFDTLIREVNKETDKTSPKNGLFQKAWDALNDDLNTPKALGEIFSVINKADMHSMSDLQATWFGWLRMLYAFGLNVQEKKQTIEIPENIRQFAQERWQAKSEKNWARADELRKQIADAGWEMRDKKDSYDLAPASQRSM
ncbi:MAG: cysteine--tRNA ligase [Verrucomicrobiota bacterium]